MTEEFWIFLVTAACAVLGYTLVSLWISRGTKTVRVEEPEPEKPGESPKSTRVEAWYVVLGVGQNASFEEIRGAFRREMSKYHPDRVANLGPELQALAELRAKAINKAYGEATQRQRRRA